MSFIYSLFISLKNQETLPDKTNMFFNRSLLKERFFRKNINHEGIKQTLSYLVHIEELVLEGKYSDALPEIELLSQNVSLSHHKKFLLSLLKAEIYTTKSEPKRAEQIALTIFENIPQNANPFYKIDMLLTLIDVYNSLGDHVYELKFIEECEQLLKKVTTNSTDYNLNLRKITSWLYKARNKLNFGNRIQGLEFAQKAVTFSKEVAYIPGLAHAYSLIGFYHGVLGNLAESLNYRLQALELYKKVKDKRFIAYILDLIGTIYMDQGDEDTALKYQLEVLNLSKSIDNKYIIGYNTRMIGIIHFYKGEFENSLYYLKNAVVKFEEVEHDDGTADCLWILIYISVLVHDEMIINKYFEKFKDIIGRVKDNKFIDQRYQFSEAIILKSSNRLANKIKAQELFQQLYAEEGVFYQIKNFSILSLCELFLDELKATGNKELLVEIKSLISKLIDFATAQHVYTDLIRAYIILSRVVLLEFDIKHSQNLLTLAQNIAEEKGLKFLTLFVSKELDDFTAKSSQYMELIQKHVTINDLIELMFPEDNLAQLLYKRTVTMLNLQPETPVMFLIVINTGLCLFSQSFTGTTSTDDQLVAGLLTAINQFSGEIFSQTIDRIKFHEYTLLLKAKEPFLFCYLFSGASYTALKRLENFILKISSDLVTWEILLENVKLGRTLPPAEHQIIDQYIQEILYIS